MRLRAVVLDGLPGEAATVAMTAVALFERLLLPRPNTGNCYLTTMFLSRHLRKEHGIATEAVVGHVNNGMDDVFISHACLEFNRLKTDFTLSSVEHGHAVPNGASLVLDYVLRQGKVRQSYHVVPTEAGLAQNRAMMAIPDLRAIMLHKEQEHLDLITRALIPEAMVAYVDCASRE